MDKIKILCLSIWYPLSISRYFEKALKRNPHIDLITTGVYTGSWIPWMGGMNLLEKYANPPTYPLPFKPGTDVRIPYELVRAQIPDSWHPDLILTIDAGTNWNYKPQEGIVATVATDGHCLNTWYEKQGRRVSDYFFNMHPAYSMPNDIRLHYAFCSETHFATSNEKDVDAVLIGMPYRQRVDWVNALRAHGVSVIFENGPVFDEYRELSNRAKIGLNWSSLDDTNARVYEIMAMRLCPVTNRTPDLNMFFTEGKHYLGFDTIAEAIEKVLWAKDHPKEAEMIANCAYQKVHGDNLTYDKLINDMLKECGLYA